MSRSRNYCFTDFEILDFEKIYEDYKDVIRYLCWGEEKCKTSGRRHLQGWVQFYNPKRFGRVKNIFGTKKIHLESCKGTAFDNNKYCQKDGKFQTLGKFVSQGYRSDLEVIKKLIDQGVKRDEICNSNFETYCRYRKGICDAIEFATKKNTKKFRKVSTEYVWGATGTGKTRYAMEQPDVFKIHASDLNWFDGYNGEKTLVIDEYSNDIKVTKLLGLLDGYQLRLPVKGGFTYADWDRVVITSNLSPDLLHMHANQAHRNALFRRITKQIQMT